MKKLICGYCLALVISFMLYIFEPIVMYISNVNDFWFDLRLIIDILINNFVMFLALICIFFTVVYLLSEYIFKKISVYNIFFLIVFTIFLATYIQGNYLAGFLPGLDGHTINWSLYTKITLVTGAIWIVIGTIVAVLAIKVGLDKTVKISTLISLAVLFMLGTSFATTLTNPKIDEKKDFSLSVTTKNYNNASSDSNFFIFVLDAVDSVDFEKVLNSNEEFKDTFSDFTYFKDTVCAYPYTRDSIPFIFSGIWNENEKQFSKYYDEALNKSLLFKELDKRNYNTNVYETEFPTKKLKTAEISNLIPAERKLDEKKFIGQLHRYLLFKYLPFGLKQYANIEKLDFGHCYIQDETIKPYNWENEFNYDMIKNNKIEKINQKYFSFVHVRGGHVPFNFDKNLNEVKHGTYERNLEGCLTLINAFLDRLKENGVYDNSAIIIMADHGFSGDEVIDGRQNPILFIKGINEHHSMITSKIPVSYADLNDVYVKLLDGKSSKQLFSDISLDRKRRYIWYRYTHEEYMVEYIQKGKAWDEKTMNRTGEVYKI